MSADYRTTVGYGSHAKVAEGVINENFGENDLDTAIYDLQLKYVEVASFGDYRSQGTLDMDLAVLMSSSDYSGIYADSMDDLGTPVITDAIVAELNKLRKYLDFNDVDDFKWIIGQYIC